MQILLVILSLVLLIYLCFKGVPIFFGAMISGIFLLVTAGKLFRKVFLYFRSGLAVRQAD